MENDGNVIWKSSKFTTEFANIDINTYIDDITLDIKEVIEKENNDNQQNSKNRIRFLFQFVSFANLYITNSICYNIFTLRSMG